MKCIESSKIRLKSDELETIGNQSHLGNLNITDGNLVLEDGYFQTRDFITPIFDDSSAGIITNLSTIQIPCFRFNNPNLIKIAGLSNGRDGKNLLLINNTRSSLTILNDSTLSNSQDRIFTGGPNLVKDILLGDKQSLNLIYDNSIQKWRIISGNSNSKVDQTRIFYYTFDREEVRTLQLNSQGITKEPHIVNLEFFDGTSKKAVELSGHLLNKNNQILEISTWGLEFNANCYLELKALLLPEESIDIAHHRLKINYEGVFRNGNLLPNDSSGYEIIDSDYGITHALGETPQFINIYYFNGNKKIALDNSSHILGVTDEKIYFSTMGLNMEPDPLDPSKDPYVEIHYTVTK